MCKCLRFSGVGLIRTI